MGVHGSFNYVDDNSTWYSADELHDALDWSQNGSVDAREWFENNGMQANLDIFKFMLLYPLH